MKPIIKVIDDAMIKLSKLVKPLSWEKFEVDNQLYRRLMNLYFRMNKWNYATTITSVKTFRQKDKLIIKIETHRPGLLIGKAGKFIDGLRDFISNIKKLG